MAKNIMVPCHVCKEEQEGATDSPQRTITGGKFLRDEEDVAVFALTLECGHEIEFDFAEEEKADVMELLEEVSG